MLPIVAYRLWLQEDVMTFGNSLRASMLLMMIQSLPFTVFTTIQYPLLLQDYTAGAL